jgi:tRNA-dependent cyclodipeptide synthase
MNYLVKAIDLQPKESRLQNHKNAFLGVSLNNPIFRQQILESLLEWIADRFNRTEIVITDYLDRYNQQVFEGLTAQDATNKVLCLGEELKEIFESQAAPFPKNRFAVFTWRDFCDSDNFQSRFRCINDVFDQSERFRIAVNAAAKNFIDRQLQRGKELVCSVETAMSLSTEYLLQEMAFIDLMASRGNKVSIYPGTQLKLLKDISNGNYNEIDANLRKVIYVDLAISKRGTR